MPLMIGAKGEAETIVSPHNTAAAVGSGSLPVFATPMMVALMEQAAVNALAGQLEPNCGYEQLAAALYSMGELPLEKLLSEISCSAV